MFVIGYHVRPYSISSRCRVEFHGIFIFLEPQRHRRPHTKFVLPDGESQGDRVSYSGEFSALAEQDLQPATRVLLRCPADPPARQSSSSEGPGSGHTSHKGTRLVFRKPRQAQNNFKHSRFLPDQRLIATS
jgi:hypothetical protein